jgi:hypothetical protein
MTALQHTIKQRKPQTKIAQHYLWPLCFVNGFDLQNLAAGGKIGAAVARGHHVWCVHGAVVHVWARGTKNRECTHTRKFQNAPIFLDAHNLDHKMPPSYYYFLADSGTTYLV